MARASVETVWLTGRWWRIHTSTHIRAHPKRFYTHLIRAEDDPERSPRPKGGRKDRQPHRTLRMNTTAEEWADRFVGLLADGVPRTFNRMGVELCDLTADVLFTTPANDGLWLAVEHGRLEHTSEAPVLFRVRQR